MLTKVYRGHVTISMNILNILYQPAEIGGGPSVLQFYSFVFRDVLIHLPSEITDEVNELCLVIK